jgi:transposase-like protein
MPAWWRRSSRSSPKPPGSAAELAPAKAGVHFLRNALDHLPRKHGDDCLQELRWLYDRRDLAEAKADLAAWLAKWSARYPRLTNWGRRQ